MPSQIAIAPLRRREDWWGWFEEVRVVCKRYKVWDYIDPSKEKDELATVPTLEIPGIDATEAEEIIYRVKRTKYEEIEQTIEAIGNAIGNSLPAHLKRYHTNNPGGPYQVLRALQNSFAPNQRELERFAVERYKQALSAPLKLSNAEEWVLQFEAALYEMREHNLPEARESDVVRDFLIAVGRVSKDWAMFQKFTRYDQEDSNSKVKSIEELAFTYRGYVAMEKLYQDHEQTRLRM